MGKARTVESLVVRRPSGTITKIGKTRADVMLTVREGQGIIEQKPLRRKPK